MLSGPTANTDAYAVPHDRALIVTPSCSVLVNDTGSAPLTASLVTSVQHGTMSFKSDGTFVYMPNAGFSGSDSLTYQAYDGTSYSNVATVSLTVGETAPMAGNTSVSVGHDRSVVITPPVTDAEHDPITLALASNPLHGSVVINANASLTYTPNARYYGTDSFTYNASDGLLTSATPGTVSLTINETAPVANTGYYTTAAGQVLNSTVTAPPSLQTFDSDAEGDGLTTQLLAAPSNGTAVVNTDGTYLYTPNFGFSGVDSFTYTESDGLLTSPPATVSIQVGPQTALTAQPPSGGVMTSTLTEGASAGTLTLLTFTAPGVSSNNLAAEVRGATGPKRPAASSRDRVGSTSPSKGRTSMYRPDRTRRRWSSSRIAARATPPS
jgi:titin